MARSNDIDWLSLSNRQYVAGWGPQTRYRKGAGRDVELRNARHAAHRAFDKIWRCRHMTRTDAYHWLALQMGMPRGDCHMGMMTVEECQRVEALANEYLKERTKR